MKHLNILLLEADFRKAQALWEAVAGPQWPGGVEVSVELTYTDCLDTALQRLTDAHVDVILVDRALLERQGMQALGRLIQQAPTVPVLVLTQAIDEVFASEVGGAGAQGCLVKDRVGDDRLVDELCHAVERHHLQQAIRASEMRFRNLIVRHVDGIVVVDRSGVIRFVNPAAEAMFGYPADRLIDTVFGFPVVAGETTELDIVGRLHGEMVVAEMRVVETEWEGNTAYLASLRDITKRKQAEKTLRQQEELLRQAQKMEAIGRLAGGVAHDFNNLLTAIVGYSDMMLTRVKPDEPLHRYADRISKAANRAALITRQLLTFSRRQQVQPRPLSLNTVVLETQNMLRPLIGEDIDLRTDLAAPNDCVYADPGHIQQLVINLVINARDAMPQGGRLLLETRTVELHKVPLPRYLGAPTGCYVMLSVTDTGHGMNAETLAHLFEPFFTTKEVGKGTGLGLAVVYSIMQQSGGDIAIESTVGQGTTFRVYLPKADAVQPDAAPLHTADMAPPGRETVLLVEDEEIVRAFIHDTLRINGYHVLEATDPREALRLCEQHERPIHLLVTDMVMPGMSGRELAERVSPLRPEMRVMFVSGHADDTVARRGVLDTDPIFLQKPFTADSLARKVRQLLDMPAATWRLRPADDGDTPFRI